MPASSCLKRDRVPVFCCIAFVLALLQRPDLTAQTGLPLPSTPAALSPFQQRALLAFAPSGTSFTNLTLTGTVKRIAGSLKETGTVTFRSASDGSYSETWDGAGANREISCASWSDGRTCTIRVAGKTKNVEGVLSERTTPWFAPWTGMSALTSSVASALQSVDGQGDTVLTFAPEYGSLQSLKPEKQKAMKQTAQAASTSILFDAKSGLPSGMHYTEPLSTETGNAIDVSVVYSDYRLEQGFMLPHRIQRYIQRTLESDIHITSVTLS